MSLADTVLMIQPTNFVFNEEASLSNSFQNKPVTKENHPIQANALVEFLDFKDKLVEIGVRVICYADTNLNTPDSLFPNNWFSTHETGELVIYPMAITNRRAERRSDIVQNLIRDYAYTVLDHSIEEESDQYLEGTGSLIFDHQARKVYAALSPRTNKELVNKVAAELSYEPVTFKALGKVNELIYHTNVMLSIGADFAVIGTDTIIDDDRQRVLHSLVESGKQLIELSNDQVYDSFAGNMLQLKNDKGQRILVMSEKAYNALKKEQLKQLSELNDILLPISIPTIENIGGGSVRCMLAEIF